MLSHTLNPTPRVQNSSKLHDSSKLHESYHRRKPTERKLNSGKPTLTHSHLFLYKNSLMYNYLFLGNFSFLQRVVFTQFSLPCNQRFDETEKTARHRIHLILSPKEPLKVFSRAKLATSRVIHVCFFCCILDYAFCRNKGTRKMMRSFSTAALQMNPFLRLLEELLIPQKKQTTDVFCRLSILLEL